MKSQVKELAKKQIKDLYKELDESRKKLVDMKFQLAQGKLKNHREVFNTKKKIARILTIISAKQWEDFGKNQEKKDGK
ncbi:50S ribosomal protein L29 [bacterium CG_4_10_14_0_2_um_filter_33_32]|nr:MAG: 50S ribosomal protein L29 [bacterium CG2_30_33_46]PIR67367.1 MAG: 50S ribosomal protein L29 [bacterium CG10_big_fil_rev_8_21_14_0_10_33_18]PIU76754.1 MAG: 50S ribosomal protein L29 [bacterium CG06_land_8_20_14_3_00_33_50]PIW81300.1 MAG: 50S ribosomal protein L29 [bacterium CG_4_8_14_3_um_filter_33_28]PIY85711.1 MAG: 50S ribosomal protein L29 [bacterium CG_4_10_14_0_8_um_filter_33_57]PIZ86586.1 MAG: 50S ribosomal protein L29 [bacterium CG_4_10_14_0_2_um_filter_33_32]PJA72115.1 MAG: 50S